MGPSTEVTFPSHHPSRRSMRTKSSALNDFSLGIFATFIITALAMLYLKHVAGANQERRFGGC